MLVFWQKADEIARFHARRKGVDEDQAASDAQIIIIDTIERPARHVRTPLLRYSPDATA